MVSPALDILPEPFLRTLGQGTQTAQGLDGLSYGMLQGLSAEKRLNSSRYSMMFDCE